MGNDPPRVTCTKCKDKISENDRMDVANSCMFSSHLNFRKWCDNHAYSTNAVLCFHALSNRRARYAKKTFRSDASGVDRFIKAKPMPLLHTARVAVAHPSGA